MKYCEFNNKEVKRVFDHYPKKVSDNLLHLRELIYRIAEKHEEIGMIEETLKWENPSYLTNKPKSGTTIRLSWIQACENKCAISVHCQTSLISEFKEVFPNLNYDGNRSIILNLRRKLPIYAIKHFIYLALTYHYRKKHGVGISRQ